MSDSAFIGYPNSPTVNLATGVTGILGIGNGGTGATAVTNNQILFIDGGAYAQDSALAWDNTNKILKLGGGTETFTAGTNTLFSATKTGNTYITANIQNLSAGTTASADFIINADNATDTTNYLDIGIASSGNTDANYTIAGAGQAYIYNQSNALAIGTAGAYSLKFFTGGTLAANLRQNIDQFGNVSFTPAVQTSGSPNGFTFSGAAHTTLTASVEASDIFFKLARTVQFSTGALATQRAINIQAPTYGFVGASTITNAATVGITGAPVKGTNATITNTHALLISAGAVSTATASYGITVNAQTGATNNYAAQFLGGNIGLGIAPTATSWVTFGATTTAKSSFNLPTGTAPTAPVDGDVWREDNTNTGLKIRINGVTKTITVS